MTPSSSSIWISLRHRTFRVLWASSAVYFIGSAMQTMAAAWLMVELTGSSFLAALVQTAVFFPMFILSLPAGVLADITDRRKLLLIALMTQAVIGALLALLLFAGLAGPASLLFFIFLSGCCTALMSPAWNSTIADTVPREELPQAITALSVAYNAARAIGPTLAGGLFAIAGGGNWNFVIAVISTIAMVMAIRAWPPSPHPPSRLPAERMWGGMLSALRFARHSHTVLSQLVRTIAYSGAGSALWALLPIIGQQKLHLGATGFGFLMGCLGSGAVTAGFLIGQVRARFGLESVVQTGCIVFALAMLMCAFTPWPLAVYTALFFAGAVWMAVMSTFNTATQTSVPPWVRARAMAMHTLCALGSFALGSAIWGAFADLFGLVFALCLASIAMLGGLFLAKKFPLRTGNEQEVTQASSWDVIALPNAPKLEDGPIAVEIIYCIKIQESAAFLESISHLRAPRQRDGATFWRVYRDLGNPARYVERFIVTSWADYLHQRARATLADQYLELRVRSYLQSGENVAIQHYIAER